MASQGSLEKALQSVPVVNCVGLLRLFHAVDCMPRGGLYAGYYALAAATRYERFWLKTLALNRKAEVPPLDVAFAWFVHRQGPADYHRVSSDYNAYIHPNAQHAFAFDATRCNRTLWKAAAGEHPVWPPPAPGSVHDPLPAAGGSSQFVIRLAGFMSRFSRLLHSWLRPHFLDANFLRRAQQRYGRFLSLHADHPDVVLAPPADVALVWHTHLGLSGKYAAACEALFGAAAPPWRPDYLDLSPDKLGEAYEHTARLYMEKYGEPVDDPDTAWLPHSVPYPLAAPGSPIAWALSVFDENPQQDYQRSALLAAAARTGFPMVDVPVVRSGAHALFAAWLAVRRAQKVYDTAINCLCGFPTSLEEAFRATLKHTLACLVSVAYFLELPDKDSHPYITAIKLRSDLWNPCASIGTRSSTFLSVASGFSPYDPARYLAVRESFYLLGLAPLIASGNTEHGEEQDNALWLILCKQGLREVAETKLSRAQQRAAKHGVGHLQRVYKQFPDRNFSCVLSSSTEYYTTDLCWWQRLERWIR